MSLSNVATFHHAFLSCYLKREFGMPKSIQLMFKPMSRGRWSKFVFYLFWRFESSLIYVFRPSLLKVSLRPFVVLFLRERTLTLWFSLEISEFGQLGHQAWLGCTEVREREW